MTTEVIEMITTLAQQGGTAAVWLFIVHQSVSLLKLVIVMGGLTYGICRFATAIKKGMS